MAKPAQAVTPAALSVTSAAHYLGISRRTLERLMAERQLPVVQVSPGRRVLRVVDLDEYLASQVQPVAKRRAGAA